MLGENRCCLAPNCGTESGLNVMTWPYTVAFRNALSQTWLQLKPVTRWFTLVQRVSIIL